MTIVIAAGGTGGHIFPALAVAQAIRQRSPERRVVFFGTGAEIERRLIGGAGFELEELPSAKVKGAGLKGILRLALTVPRALSVAIALHRKLQTKAIIGFGGYPAVMPLVAAWVRGVPSLLHEQNVQVGLANRFLSLLVDRVYAVPGAQGFWTRKKVRSLSNPVRQEFETIPAWALPTDNRLNLLVVGGSQGAVTLNSAIIESLPQLKAMGISLIHQTGDLDYERVSEAYSQFGIDGAEVRPFIEDIAQCYGRAHLVVCRAGAMTAAEVSASGRPAIYVPLRIAAGHQAENVRHLVESGAARMIEQGPELAVKLLGDIKELVSSPELIGRMAAKAKESSLAGGKSAASELATVLVEGRGHFSA